MAPPKKKGLPKPLPDGFVLTDTEKKKWRLGKIIGQGGFGLIYLASQDVDRPVAADTAFVIKVEYHENGPLFSELKFYQRAAKPESMEKWKKSRKLDFLGIPTYWGSGLAEYNDLRYRFMAMDRLGSDLQKVCDRNGGRLKRDTVLQLGQGLVAVLEYIHENEYVHADIKAANLMLGFRDPEQVYLADYGLSYRYCPDGVHKEYKENPKKGHNGTIEYTSLDAHKGLAPSRRGDLQILGFCLLHWLCGSLPWGNLLKNPTQVQEAKTRLMDNLPESVQQLSASGASTDEVAKFLLYVKNLDYQAKPDYQALQAMLASGVPGRLDFSVPQGPARESTAKRQDPPARVKKAGRPRGPSKAKAEPIEVDDEDNDEEETKKSKPVPARYTRGPTPTKPKTRKREGAVPPPVSRPTRQRAVVSYEEYDSGEDEDEDDEEEARSGPISACYLRGPPIGPRAQSKQNTRPTWMGGTTDDLGATSEGRVRSQRRKHVAAADVELRERWDERLLHHGAGRYSYQQRWDRELRYRSADNFSDWDGSAGVEGPQWAAGLTQANGLFSLCVFASVCLFLGAVLGVCQSAFKPL